MRKLLTLCIAALVLVSIVAACSASVFPSDRDYTVGEDIQPGDITDFYYTYDASTDPPVYQRYRFFVEDGTPMFHHEQREGDHWPLTEDDITVSGTWELTPDEWSAFFEILRGGSASAREEHLESGGAGPWLYLYWRGDRGTYQEFSFDTVEDELEFEAFCRELAEQ